MNWGGWRDFLHMGGYARYVWGAYGVVALAVIIELVGVRMRLMRARRAGRARSARSRARP
jgi:heme exporter protein D